MNNFFNTSWLGRLRLFFFLIVVCTTFLAGCTGKPQVVKLPEDIPQTWGLSQGKLPPISGKILDLLSDDRLRLLAHEALNNNPDIGASGDQLMAQAALLGVSRSQLWPSFFLGISGGRSKTNATASGKADTLSSHNANLGLSWELDVWGKIRDSYDSESASLTVSRLEYQAARDSLVVRTLQAWIRVVGLSNSITIAEERIHNLEMIQQRVLSRYRDGIGSIDELATANTRIHSASADKTDTVEMHAQAIRELELLLGRYPKNLCAPGSIYPQLEIPTLFNPGEILVRRPDVQAALEQARAAALQVSATQKNYLPSFILTGKLFSENIRFSDLLSGVILWDMLVSASQPVFNAGRIKNEVASKRWEYEAAVKRLKAFVLKACGEVQQYWGIEQMLQKKETFLQAAGKEANRSYQYFEKRYLEGLDPISTMLNAKEEQISIQLQINELQAARLSNRIDLALALGLGEQDKDNPAIHHP